MTHNIDFVKRNLLFFLIIDDNIDKSVKKLKTL